VTRIEIHIAIKSMCYTGKPPNRDTELHKLFFDLRDHIAHVAMYPCKFQANSRTQIALHAVANFQWLQK